MIAETASTEKGGSKAIWIRNALENALPRYFPQVKAIVWFSWNNRGMDWAIESSPAAQQAFAKNLASSYYMENEFSDLATSPIPPCEEIHNRWRSLYQRLNNE